MLLEPCSRCVSVLSAPLYSDKHAGRFLSRYVPSALRPAEIAPALQGAGVQDEDSSLFMSTGSLNFYKPIRGSVVSQECFWHTASTPCITTLQHKLATLGAEGRTGAEYLLECGARVC